MIRLVEPQIGEEEFRAVREVLSTGMLIQGKRVAEFEAVLAEFMGATQVLAVSSGTAALHLALAALGIGPGDAVFVPAFTFPATANVVELQRARPVFVDVDPETYCITEATLREAIRTWAGPERPRAVMPVHEFGAPCPMDDIMSVAREFGLVVIEDAACALGTVYHGRHVGTLGEIGCFSWHPRKAITTGEGGAVVTQDAKLHDRVSLLRNHGMQRNGDGMVDFVAPGFNYRMTEFQAVLGTSQLRRFEQALAARRSLAVLYRCELSGVPGLRLPADIPGHSWQTFMIVLPEGVRRKAVIAHLHSNGIESNLGAQALHLLSYYGEKYGYYRQQYPVAAELYERGLALPIHGALSQKSGAFIAAAIKEAMMG